MYPQGSFDSAVMTQHKPKVLMLATDWALDNSSASETLTINRKLASRLAADGVDVYCTVPHFRHDLQGNEAIHKSKDATSCGVKLIGADYRKGRREEPETSWITDDWLQYYENGVKPDGYNCGFTHVVAYVPDTYHAALDMADHYRDLLNMRVILIVTDIDDQGYSVKDSHINEAHTVYVVGPNLFDEYHLINHKFKTFLPVFPVDDVNVDATAVHTNGLKDNTKDIKIGTAHCVKMYMYN